MSEVEDKKMAVYEKEIAPLVQQASELAQKHNINFLAMASFKNGHFLFHNGNINEETNGKAPQLVVASVMTRISPSTAQNLCRPGAERLLG